MNGLGIVFLWNAICSHLPKFIRISFAGNTKMVYNKRLVGIPATVRHNLREIHTVRTIHRCSRKSEPFIGNIIKQLGNLNLSLHSLLDSPSSKWTRRKLARLYISFPVQHTYRRCFDDGRVVLGTPAAEGVGGIGGAQRHRIARCVLRRRVLQLLDSTPLPLHQILCSRRVAAQARPTVVGVGFFQPYLGTMGASGAQMASNGFSAVAAICAGTLFSRLVYICSITCHNTIPDRYFRALPES